MNELEKKYDAQITEPFKLKGIMSVNFDPHPFCVGPKHIAEANKGGEMAVLDDAVCDAVGCSVQGCQLTRKEHKFDLIMFVQLTRDCSNQEAQFALSPLTDDMEKDKIDGFSFVETSEKFRVT